MTAPTFRTALDWLDKHEGTFSNHRADKGGATKYGITSASYPTENIATLTRQRAEYLYERDFWLAPGIDEIQPPRLAVKVFDIAANMGASRAIRLLQESLRLFGAAVKVDGVLGPKTLETLAAVRLAASEEAVLAALSHVQARRYVEIIDRDPTQRAFLLGWIRRAIDQPPLIPDAPPAMLAAADAATRDASA